VNRTAIRSTIVEKIERIRIARCGQTTTHARAIAITDLPFHVFACENRHRRPGRAIADIHPVYAKPVFSAIDKRLLGPILRE
jgi:hypothetical protein